MRALVLVHRWLGVAMCLFFAMWFASGIALHFVPYPDFDRAERLAGEQKKNILDQRENILGEIRESIEHMQSAVKHYQELMGKEEQSDLGSLRDELDTSLRIAKRTEERMRELEGSLDFDTRMKE